MERDLLSNLDESIASTFDGYKNLNICGNVTAIVKEDEIVNTINEGEKAIIVLDVTSFYAEGGGQAGDVGTLENEEAIFEVVDTRKGANNTIKHIGICKKRLNKCRMTDLSQK